MAPSSLPFPWRRYVPIVLGSLAIVALMWTTDQTTAQTKKTTAKVTPILEPKATVKDLYVADSGNEQVRYINELVEKKWTEDKIRPAARCTDHEFIRRASLDIIGRIATLDEVARYMKDPESKRRSMLIERLLDSPEFGENFANIWTTMLLTRQGSKKVHQEQLRDWLTEKFNDKSTDPENQWTWAKISKELVTATGKSNENQAVNFVLHHMGEEIKQDRGQNGAWDMVPVTSRTTRLFLGLRTQCVQCHDHPFNGEWAQQHFWGINAFFRQTTASGRPGMMNQKKKKGEIETAVFELRDDKDLNTGGLVPFERRSGVLFFARPTFLDGTKMDLKKTSSTRREVLANQITKSPYFAKVFVNRMWGHFFGKSFTKDAMDDFGEHNPVTNPELLDRLAEDWAKSYNHMPKDVVRWICNSRAYGLSSVANETNDKPEDEIYFARMLMKQMTPEQLFESVVLACDMQSIQKDKKAKEAVKQDWLDKLVANFGNDEGEEVSFNGTVVQALMLMNGADINSAINGAAIFGALPKDGRQLLGNERAERQILDTIYLMTLNRPARDDEYFRIMKKVDTIELGGQRRAVQLRSMILTGSTNAEVLTREFYKDILWAVLNSNEFILNH